jgi:hypothetical protein
MFIQHRWGCGAEVMVASVTIIAITFKEDVTAYCMFAAAAMPITRAV